MRQGPEISVRITGMFVIPGVYYTFLRFNNIFISFVIYLENKNIDIIMLLLATIMNINIEDYNPPPPPPQ